MKYLPPTCGSSELTTCGHLVVAESKKAFVCNHKEILPKGDIEGHFFAGKELTSRAASQLMTSVIGLVISSTDSSRMKRSPSRVTS
jgi:hypothetical protein